MSTRTAAGLVLFAAAARGQCCLACSEPTLPAPSDVVTGCEGLTECPEAGLNDGAFSISGVASIDSYFPSIQRFDAQAALVAGRLDRHLRAIARLAGLEGGARADFAREPQATVRERFGLRADLAVHLPQPRCALSSHAVLEAAARCDASIDPGSEQALCSGTCDMGTLRPHQDPGEIDCGPDGKLWCVGVAQELSCPGPCLGEGLVGTAEACEGLCVGVCESPVAAAPLGGGAQLQCRSCGESAVLCDGPCMGRVTPSGSEAQCLLSAHADAMLDLECSFPSAAGASHLGASGVAQAEEPEAWLFVLREEVSALLRQLAIAESVLGAGQLLAGAATGSVAGELERMRDRRADLSLKDIVGLGCAQDELPAASDFVYRRSSGLRSSVATARSLVEALGSAP